MKVYSEEDFLMLSGLQHYAFCKRQWALIHIEQQWKENYLTTDGNIMHEKAHDGNSFEKRKNVIISRGMPIASRQLGISGICDIVEFEEVKKGIQIYGREKQYKVYPVEYKRGKIKESDADLLQVVAQAMCLEEMFGCNIEEGYLYYGELRRRVPVSIDRPLREKVETLTGQMHKLFETKHTPKVKPTKACNACSLKELCMAKVTSKKSAKNYIQEIVGED